MTSIDDLFKKPNLPSQKRKLDATRDLNEIYKSIKLDGQNSARRDAQPTVDEEEDEEFAGPEMPPDFEEDEGDEEGRFFGGGITRGTAQALEIVDELEQSGLQKQEKIDSAWVRKLALSFEKKISKNAELRAKYEAEPQKFMGSEADLDTEVKALSILSEHTNLYEEFARLGCAASLVSLLSHENTDIAIDAIEIISELTDEDVDAEQSQWNALVDAMLEADLLDLLYQNFSRLDESIESDRSGVYHILSVLEALSSRPTVVELIGAHDSIIPWLLSRAQKKESGVGQNKQYSAEILTILLQSSAASRQRFTRLDGVDSFLQLLSAYRKRDPTKGTEEEEFVENVFDGITCVVDEVEGKDKFLEAEGIELCLIMVKEGKMSRPRALRLLDHALGGAAGGACCEKLVEAGGLKATFTTFMKKQDGQSTEHLLGIFSSMLRSLPAESAPRIRLLGKFVEKDYEKIGRLVQLRRDYASKVTVFDQNAERGRQGLSAEDREEFEEELLSRRLDVGLFSLQTTDTILAWLVAEDDGAKSKIQGILADRDETLDAVKKSLQEQLQGLGTDEVEDAQAGIKDMLGTLVKFL